MHAHRSPIRSWLALGLVLGLTCATGVAWSYDNGITGYSGKQGSTCNSCHGGGVTPTVTLDGPTALDAGATALYTFKITTTAKATGMNAAASDGTDTVLTPPDGGRLQLEDDELTHVVPTPVTGGSVLYSFYLTPKYGGTVTLFAAGNAVDLDNSKAGDDSAKTTLDIKVNGPPKPPEPDPVPPAPTTTATAPAATTPPPASSAAPSGGGTSITTTNNSTHSDSGCSIGFAERASFPGGAMLAALFAVLAVGRARRRA